MRLKLPHGFTHPVHLAEGAFSRLLRARQTALDRLVAIKILHERNSSVKRTLLDEARTQAHIEAPSIPRVYDAFIASGHVHIVMQWIRGVSLTRLLKETLSDRQRRWLVDRILFALADLHALGYAHRDIKPDNILIAPGRGVYLVDFGFTRRMVDPHTSLAGTVKGTPAYMAPELWRDPTHADPLRADIYAAGRVAGDILGDNEGRDIVDACCAENPLDRPATMVIGAQRWRERFGKAELPGNNADLGKSVCAMELSERLFESAVGLLAAGRQDEAYRLLVESLEEYPENTRAVKLVGEFPRHIRGRRIRRKLALAAGVFGIAGGLAAAYFLGKRSADERTVRAMPWENGPGLPGKIQTYLWKTDREDERRTGSATLPLRAPPATLPRLTGTVIIDPPATLEGALFHDQERVPEPRGNRYTLSLPHGEHRLQWRSPDGTVPWKERIELLPFELKRLTIYARYGGKDAHEQH